MNRRRRMLTMSVAAAVLGSLIVAVMPDASANTTLQNGPATMQDFVRSSVPQWNFPRANSNDPCWPQSAFDASGAPYKGGSLKNWPDSDGGCAKHGTPFPTYYTVQQCNPTDVRVWFTIYQGTSAFKPSGHSHDFEGVMVVWKRSGDTWYRDTLIGSSHSGVHAWPWRDAESWNADRGSAGKGREFPRIFVGFGSHAMFNNQGGLKDVLSAYTDKEYRQADYPVWADANAGSGGGLVEVAVGGELFRRFEQNAKAWGSATGNPAERAKRMCGI